MGNRDTGHPLLPAGVSRLGWIEDAIGWPSLVAPRADVVVGAMARPALRPVRMWADAPPSPADRHGSPSKSPDCWPSRAGFPLIRKGFSSQRRFCLRRLGQLRNEASDI